MSFPNPLMLPFLAAGGAISGSSFGLFYTVLMQIGYNYYGKRALKQMEEGRRLQDVLLDISKEVQPFSDEMMNLALAKMPDVIDKSVIAFLGLITQRIKNLQKTIAGEQQGISEFDKMILGWFGIQTAEARRGSGGLDEAIDEAAPPPPPPPPDEIIEEKHVPKKVTGQGTKKELLNAIRINEEAVRKSQKEQKRLLQVLSSHYNTQRYVCSTKHSLYNPGACQSVKAGIVSTRKKLQNMDREVQLLNFTLKDQRRRLAVAR